MKLPRPGTLSVRAVNQYRQREILSYLGLRYYLDSAAARSDDWVNEIATDLAVNREQAAYFEVHHFKEVTDSGDIAHRQLHLPSANEALSEAALLFRCSQHPKTFGNPACVFSYKLCEKNDRSGIFEHYVGGLKARHKAIANACDDAPQSIVSYTDIKKFYPSISLELARETWGRFSESAKLDSRSRELGETLLDGQHSPSLNPQNSLLIGPMFSHLIANLVLRKLDEKIAKTLPVRYIRYVDDITLIGGKKSVSDSIGLIRSYLEELGFELHDDASEKNIEVSAEEWLQGRYDFEKEPNKVSWMTLIGDLKRFLVSNPSQMQSLDHEFRNEGFRIPIKDYSSAVFERSFVERLRQLASKRWFRNKVSAVSIATLVRDAKELRRRYGEQFEALLEEEGSSSGYNRKRAVPKMRYRASRLIYLGGEENLASLADDTQGIPELRLQSEVMAAVSTGRLDKILSLGTNAAQAAAQPIMAAKKPCSISLNQLSDVQQQSLAILLLNGVSVEKKVDQEPSELIQFARTGANLSLMKSENLFIRELACLHGLTSSPRHAELLETAYDEDERVTLDAVDQLQQSGSI